LPAKVDALSTKRREYDDNLTTRLQRCLRIDQHVPIHHQPP